MNLVCVRGRQREYEDPASRKRYWSVSEVLHVLDPNAFVGVDPAVMAAAQERGTDLHNIFALVLLSLRGIGQRPERPAGILGGHFDAMMKFAKERKPVPEAVEEAGVNQREGYAGRPDTRCWLDGFSGDLWTLDLKSGDERPVHAAQLVGGYKRLEGYEKCARFASLYTRKTGDYRFVEHTHDHLSTSWFKAGLAVLNGRIYHKVK